MNQVSLYSKWFKDYQSLKYAASVYKLWNYVPVSHKLKFDIQISCYF